MALGVVVGLAVVVVAGIVGVGHAVAQAMERRGLSDRVDQMSMDLASWRGRNLDRIVDLGRQMSRVERAVARARSEAGRASTALDEFSRDILRRMEAVEKDMEIDILVTQGRIPEEHRRTPEPEW